MDIQGSSSCQYQHHSTCAACGVAILRRTTHAHVFRDRGGVHDEVCQRCWLLTIAAATAVLQALHKVGMYPRDCRELGDWLELDRVGVLVQTDFVDVSLN